MPFSPSGAGGEAFACRSDPFIEFAVRFASYSVGASMKTLAVLGCLIGFFAVAVLVWWWFQAGSSSPRAPEDPPWFQDITERSQLHFTHDAGPFGKFFMPQSLGSGGALLDIDGDGRLDAYLLHNGGPTGAANQLFRQLPDGRFQDVSKGSGLDFAGYCMGAAVGDVNNDGLPDVLVTEYHGARLFLNRGGNVFQDISQQAGIDNPAWGTSAAFFDYDRDGWLDLAIVNYVVYNSSIPCANPAGRPDFCAPHRFPGTVTKLFHNLGVRSTSGRTEPRFEDVTLASGLGRSPGPGLGVTCADFDGDGWPDLFVANDGKPNHLWINGRDGTFKEEALMRGVAYNILGQPQANMGVALSDVDGDGGARSLRDPRCARIPDSLASGAARPVSGPDGGGWSGLSSLAGYRLRYRPRRLRPRRVCRSGRRGWRHSHHGFWQAGRRDGQGAGSAMESLCPAKPAFHQRRYGPFPRHLTACRTVLCNSRRVAGACLGRR